MRKNGAFPTLQRLMLAPVIALALLGAGCSASTPEASLLVDEDQVSVPDDASVATQESVVAQESAESSRSGLPGPQQNLDHWHSVYGVYSCDERGEGAERYLPAFQSDRDDTGIHSHGDGLIHIHPFFELSSGENARFEYWFSEMAIQVSTESITVANEFDSPVTLVAGQECADGTGPAEIRILQWDKLFDPADPPPPDNVFTEDLESVRFVADGEVFVIAYANAATFADLPAPPADRFEALDTVSPNIDWQNLEVGRPVPVQRGVLEYGEEPTLFADEQIDFEEPTFFSAQGDLYDVPPSSITSEGQAALERVADQLIATGATVELRVYAVRPDGSPYSAFDTSLGRAVAVRDFLIALGVPVSQLVPVAYDSTETGGEDRVEIVLAD